MFSDNVMSGRKWSYDSWLSINGLYNNVAFKSDWRAGRIRLSFYTPIDHEMSWFWTTNYSPDWKTCSTNSWTLTSGNSIPSSSVSVHYFRRSFTGLSNMAAYESQFYYRDGLVAYLNGYEIYRDNMGIGPILPSTKPTSSYMDYSYRGVIRNGFDVSDSECILSVEIHLSNSVSFQFHSWLSIYASSHELSSSSICYPLVVEEVHNSFDLDMMPVADFNTSSFIGFSSISTDLYLIYKVPSSAVNSWRLLTSPMLCPLTSFDIRGRLDIKDEWSEANPSSSYTYSKVEYMTINLQRYDHHHYNMFKLTPREVMCFPSRMYEMYPMVCHLTHPVSRSSSLFSERYEMKIGDAVNIIASNDNVIGCLTDTALPSGLSFNGCSIVGSPTESVTDLRLRIYWQDDFGTLSQEVIINVLATDIPEEKPSFLYYYIIGVVSMLVIFVLLVIAYLIIVLCMNKYKKGRSKAKITSNGNKNSRDEVTSDDDAKKSVEMEETSKVIGIKVPTNSQSPPDPSTMDPNNHNSMSTDVVSVNTSFSTQAQLSTVGPVIAEHPQIIGVKTLDKDPQQHSNIRNAYRHTAPAPTHSYDRNSNHHAARIPVRSCDFAPDPNMIYENNSNSSFNRR